MNLSCHIGGLLLIVATLGWTMLKVNSQLSLPNLNPTSCALRGCGSSSTRCGPDGIMQSCNSTSGKCYCLSYQCDNLVNNCSSTVCPNPLESAECVFNKNGTSCKCTHLLGPRCGIGNNPCRLPYINQEDANHFDKICENRGANYFAGTCDDLINVPDECRCKARPLGCRLDSDCPCRQGEKDFCIRGTCTRFCRCDPLNGTACALGCPEGETSIYQGNLKCSNCVKTCSSDSDCTSCPADRPVGLCTSSGCHCFQCNVNSDCPDCANGLKKLCRRTGDCMCAADNFCVRNSDCDRDNGVGCGFFNFLTPSCCWTGCGRTGCRCRDGGGLICLGNDIEHVRDCV